jgi:hypothetical protein
MLTKNDLSQIRVVVQEAVDTAVETKTNTTGNC